MASSSATGGGAQGVRAAIPVLVREVAVPYVAYLALHSLGWTSLSALVASAVVSAAVVLLGVVRERRVSALAAVVFITVLLAIVVTLITGNARVALARDSVVTAGLGLLFIGSLAASRPLMFHLINSMAGGGGSAGGTAAEPGAARFAARWDASAEFRSALRVASLVWGAGLLLDAAIRLVLATTMPVDRAATAITVLTFATVLGLLAWMRWYFSRRLRAASAAAAAS